MASPERKRRQRGSGLVESSLCLLLFFTLVYSVMEFGRIVYSYNILAGATREATRYAIVHGGRSGSVATDSILEGKVKSWSIGLDRSAIAVNTTWSDATNKAPGSTVRVVSQYTIAPFSKLIASASFTMTSRSQMVISQ